jgi:iron complex outermembrane receptor protein
VQLSSPIALVGPAFANPLRAYYFQRGQLKSESYAAFGQATWMFQPNLTLTAGLRYTHDKKAGVEDQRQVFYNPDVDPGNSYSVLNSSRSLSDSWSGVTGKIGLDWTPTNDTLVYGAVSTGYKSGGFRLGGLVPDPTVDNETVYAYEVGYKGRFNRTLQLNTAVFYYDYRDLQVPVSINISGIVRSAFFNAPKSRTYGAEAELTWVPIEDLSFRLIYAYMNAEFTEFSGVIDVSAPTLGAQNLAGKRLLQSPENKLTLNGAYTWHFDSADLTVSATSSWIGSQYYAVFNTPRNLAPSYNKTDIRAVLDTGPYRFIASVRNVFDETAYSYITGLASTSGGGRIVTPTLPRIFGIEVQARF